MTLEELEQDFWKQPLDESSKLVVRCHELRKRKLNEYDVEDLRVMIGQNIGLSFLVPMALEKLKENILAEGDYYEGDLLKSVLSSKNDYWKENPLKQELVDLVGANLDDIKTNDELTDDIIEELVRVYKKFLDN